MRAERLCFIGGSDQQRRNAQVRAYIYIPTVSKPAVVAALDGIEKIIHLIGPRNDHCRLCVAVQLI